MHLRKQESTGALLLAITLCLAIAFPVAAQLDPLASWEGDEAEEQFGVAAALGGDFDSDGFADLAVGASTSDAGGENAGQVCVYLGGSAPPAEPDLELMGEPGSFFGAAVAWAGDVNDDGFEDLLVGAFRDDEAGTLAGKAYLYLGGDPFDGAADLVLTGPSAGAYFGRAVAGAGDLNLDGWDDFAVGAPRTAAGTVFVYFGGGVPDTIPDLVLQGPGEDSRFGTAVAGAGDVDGSEGPDLLVGASRVSQTHTWQGGAFLFSGGAGLDDLPDWSVLGEGGGDHLGSSVAGAGDVNGDGAQDILVGAPYWNDGTIIDAGAAYLYFGGAELDTIIDFSLTGDAQEDQLGRCVAGLGDVTGSGFSHFVAGAPGNDDAGAPGWVAVSSGGDPPQPDEVIILNGEDPGDQFGFSVAGEGRMERTFAGDGRPDLIVGAWSHGLGGKAYLYGQEGMPSAVDRGGSQLVSAYALEVRPNPGDLFQLSLEVPGDHSGRVHIDILDVRGSQVRSMLLRPSDAQHLTANWDGRTGSGRAVPAGVYFYRVSAGGRALAGGRLLVVR
ncbi:MAG: hypothetical protein GF355_06965 [Candidatus Eisenbacteria bacterium]|nr:hypothetical protein [Candidatus Eisenbacteria bacterium]